MIQTLLQIIMALLTVFGAYCIFLGIFYMMLNGKNGNVIICIKDDGKNTDSSLTAIHKLFGNFKRIALLTSEDLHNNRYDTYLKHYPGLRIIKTEEIKNNEGTTQSSTE